MKCCANCFNDPFLKMEIGLSTEVANCDYCESVDVKVINPGDLEDTFVTVVDTYRPNSGGKLMHEQIQNTWKTFNLDEVKRSQLLIDIHQYGYGVNPEYYDNPVVLDVDHTTGLKLAADWESFKDHIKHENRFFPDKGISLSRIRKLFAELTHKYEAGLILYRGRMTETGLIESTKMGAPPAKKATSGRANPLGISYTYLAHSIDTTLLECRASITDQITIGTFRVARDLRILDFTKLDRLSPFTIEENLVDFLANKEFLVRVAIDLSAPATRSDKELDYIATQYLCEFAKKSHFDGVQFSSSLHSGGVNVVIFDTAGTTCIETKLVVIEGISLTHNDA